MITEETKDIVERIFKENNIDYIPMFRVRMIDVFNNQYYIYLTSGGTLKINL